MELQKHNDKFVEMEEEEEENATEDDREELKVNTVKIVIFNILLPLCDLCIDVTKAVMLVFDYQNPTGEGWTWAWLNLSGFASHFHANGVYGVISLLLKWAPALVTLLHFQDLNR